MRILFVGGLYRGWRLAQRLVERGEEVVGAYVFEEDAHESPRHADRIASLFTDAGAPARKTRKIADTALAEIRDSMRPDVVFCLGWRTLIPMTVLNAAPLGGVAVHDSLLPRLRGFAPTNWGLILGHEQLGATLFQITDSVDAGDVYFQEAFKPAPDEPYEAIQERIAEIAVRLFDRYLDASRTGRPLGHHQNEAEATYTCARSPADGQIDWRDPSERIERLVRALAPPAPGAFTHHRGSPLFVTRAACVAQPRHYEGRIPGRIIERHAETGAVDVLCGEGVLRIQRVRAEDGDEQPAAAVLKSVRESLGLNYADEIVSLRRRVDMLESQLASLQRQPLIGRAG